MRIAVCDDEIIDIDKIVAFLKPYEKTNNLQISKFENGEDLVRVYGEGKRYDLLILDVKMGGMSGIETGHAIRKWDKKVLIVYLTNYDSYVFKSLKIGIFDYIIKPIERYSFNEMFQRILRRYRKDHYIVSLKWENSVYNADVRDVVYIEAYNRRVIYHMSSGIEYKTIGKLSDHERILCNYNFIRSHQGYLVNMRFIDYIKGKSIFMSDGSKTDMSTRRRNECLKSYNEYLSDHTILDL